MSGWRTARLGEICTKITDGTHHSPTNGPVGDFMYVTAKNIKPWGLDLSDISYIDAKTHREIYSRCDVQKNDILYVKDGATTGRAAINTLDKEFSLLSSVGVLRPGPLVKPKYLLYALQSPTVLDRMLGDMAGVAITRLTLRKLKDSEIPLAPLEKQAEIVAELEKQFSRLDEAVANLQRVKANLKRYKASVLKAAVEGRLVEIQATLAQREGRTYETGEQLLQRILEERRAKWSRRGKWKTPEPPTADATLPDGWTWASVDQLAEVGTGATPKRDRAAYWDDGDVPWVTSSVVNGDYVDQASELVTKLALAETNLTLYPIGTLLIAMYGEGKTRGKCTELRIPASTNQALAALQVDSPIRGYVRHFLQLNYEEMRKVASGGVQPNLNLGLIRSVCVPLPPLAEQARIVAEVDRQLSIIREVEAEVDANLQRAQALRQATLAKAFMSRATT